MTSKLLEERYREALRELSVSSRDNMMCVDCMSKKKTSFIVLQFQSYICEMCADVHRTYGHRGVKQIGLSNVTKEEVEEMRQGGNQKVKAAWYGGNYDQIVRPNPETCASDKEFKEKAKEHIKKVYIQRLYKTGGGSTPGNVGNSNTTTTTTNTNQQQQSSTPIGSNNNNQQMPYNNVQYNNGGIDTRTRGASLNTTQYANLKTTNSASIIQSSNISGVGNGNGNGGNKNNDLISFGGSDSQPVQSVMSSFNQPPKQQQPQQPPMMNQQQPPQQQYGQPQMMNQPQYGNNNNYPPNNNYNNNYNNNFDQGMSYGNNQMMNNNGGYGGYNNNNMMNQQQPMMNNGYNNNYGYNNNGMMNQQQQPMMNNNNGMMNQNYGYGQQPQQYNNMNNNYNNNMGYGQPQGMQYGNNNQQPMMNNSRPQISSPPQTPPVNNNNYGMTPTNVNISPRQPSQPSMPINPMGYNNQYGTPMTPSQPPQSTITPVNPYVGTSPRSNNIPTPPPTNLNVISPSRSASMPPKSTPPSFGSTSTINQPVPPRQPSQPVKTPSMASSTISVPRKVGNNDSLSNQFNNMSLSSTTTSTVPKSTPPSTATTSTSTTGQKPPVGVTSGAGLLVGSTKKIDSSEFEKATTTGVHMDDLRGNASKDNTKFKEINPNRVIPLKQTTEWQ